MFLESPWPAVVVGIVVETMLAIALLRTGRGVILWAMLAVAALVGAAVAVEHFTVTDRKLVGQTVYGAAAAVESNDFNRLMTFVAPRAVEIRGEAQRVLAEIKFSKVSVRNLEVVVNRLTSPPSAKATFNVFVSGADRRGEFGELSRPAKVALSLDLIDGRWLITAHDVKLDPHDL
jgi:hypothetical protein